LLLPEPARALVVAGLADPRFQVEVEAEAAD
jgi:enamine deaminase RidA (YjgF/YER057c/UK114 family)